MARAASAEATLFGPPRNVVGTVSVDAPEHSIVPVTLTLGDDPTLVRARVRTAGAGASQWRLRLPRTTPPGLYEGRATIGKRDFRLRVEVSTKLRVRVHPQLSHVRGAAGERAEFELALVNDGNVPLTVDRTYRFDLDDDRGLERVLGRTSRARLTEGESRADRFFDEISTEHAGEATVTVLKGSGEVAPGETRRIHCRILIPEAGQPGTTYVGGMDFGPVDHDVAVQILAPKRTQTPSDKGKPR